MHKHNDALELILIQDGYGVHIIGGHKYYTEAGDLLILDQGVVHDESASENLHLSIYSCALTNLRLRGLPYNHLLQSGQSPILKTGENFPLLSHIIESIYSYATQKSSYHPEEAGNYLMLSFLVIVHGLLQHTLAQTNNPKENKLAQDIKDYVDLHYTEELTLNKLAEQFHLSTYYLSHIFKKIYGYALIQYMTRRRIGEAQTLLIDTKLSVTDIAMHVGYNSTSYFHDTFNKITGTTPRKYREIYKKI